MAYTIQEISRRNDPVGNTWINFQVSEYRFVELKFNQNPSSEEAKYAIMNYLDENIQIYDE